MAQPDPNQVKMKKVLDQISGLPTLPAVISQVTKLMQNPRVSANEVGQAISNDQALATKILKVVNSSFYGFPSRITTITHAIVILGFNSIRATALSASVFQTFGKSDKESSFNREAFWKHSIAVGAAAKILAKKMQMKEIEETFLAGLMHDLGKVVLDQFMHEQFEEIIAYVKTNNCIISNAERAVIGVTHADIGMWLAQKWNLNQEFIYIIGNHHSPTSASDYFKINSIIHVADILIRAMDIGNSGDNLIPKVNIAAWKLLNIQDDDLPLIFKDIAEEVQKAEIFYNIAKEM